MESVSGLCVAAIIVFVELGLVFTFCMAAAAKLGDHLMK